MKEETTTSCCRVSLNEDIVIPPMHETLEGKLCLSAAKVCIKSSSHGEGVLAVRSLEDGGIQAYEHN